MSDENVDAVDTEIVVEVDEVEGDAPVEGAEALGDPGKKALDAMKAQRKAALDEARQAKAEIAELRAKLEGREAEHAKEQERQQAKDEALAAANQRILGAELKAAAKGKLADPSDAAVYINLGDFEVSDAGDVDTDALTAAIDELITRKPYLAAGKPRRFEGDADAGQKDGAKGAQITSREELKRMTPEQVVEAEAAGRLDKMLGRG